MVSSAVAAGRIARTTGEDGASLDAETTSAAPLARWAAISSPSGMLAVVTVEPSGRTSRIGSPASLSDTSRPAR